MKARCVKGAVRGVQFERGAGWKGAGWKGAKGTVWKGAVWKGAVQFGCSAV